MITIALIDAYLAKELLLKPISKQVSSEEKNIKNKISVEKKVKKESPAKIVQVQKQPEKNPIEKPKIVQKIEKKAKTEEKPPQYLEKPIQKSISRKNISESNTPGILLVAKEFTRLREEPDLNSKVITIVRKGAIVKVIGKKAHHWKKIIYKSGKNVYEGWVDDRFFKPKGSQ